MRKYKHLFFDLDGTLWDLHRNTRLALNELFIQNQLDQKIEFDAFFKKYHHHNNIVWELYRKDKITKQALRTVRFERTFAEFDLFPSEAWISNFADQFMTLAPQQPHLMAGAIELLHHCKDKYHLHIITNGFQEVQGIKMKAGGIDHFFNQIIFSEMAGSRKPNAQIFAHALESAGANLEESLMIGDDWEADILGARDFGMDQAWLTSTEDAMELMRLDVQKLQKESHRNRIRHNYKPTFTIHSLHELQEKL